MNISKYFLQAPKYPLSVSFYSLIIGWTLIIAGIAFWSYKSIYDETILLAKREAYKGYEKDVMFRSWATMHGGVYVPITDKTEPNPYLASVKERDIETTSGKKLTLMNPAYMTRQVHELSFEKIGIIGHITSLNPIRKANAADKWETEALTSFEKGEKEKYGFDYINNEKYFRYMAPLVTEIGCISCHEVQGYKVGEIRGGISSSVPWITYQASINTQTTKVFIGYGLLWIIGFVGISMVKKKFIIYISRRDVYEEEMKKLNEELYISKSMIEKNLIERNAFINKITEANNKLLKLNSEKDKFFSIIAHDLKSPFNGIIGLTDMIAEDYAAISKVELAKLNKEIHFSAKNLYKLLLNLLEWSQMQNGMMTYLTVKINLEEAVLQNINLQKQNAEQKGIKINNYVEPRINICADENMLNSILRNIISNSVKFSVSGGLVEVRAREIDDSWVEIAISDSGIGISETLVKKLFRIEEKVGRKGTNGEHSTGLGLLLCKEFVERHGGKIWVESQVDKGTTFYFTLPNNGSI